MVSFDGVWAVGGRAVSRICGLSILNNATVMSQGVSMKIACPIACLEPGRGGTHWMYLSSLQASLVALIFPSELAWLLSEVFLPSTRGHPVEPG